MNSPYQTLKFPLNVYAHSLYLQEGRAEYLQFGLFDDTINTMYLAQQQAMDILFQHLPASPCRVLEMGANPATMRKHLLHLGYQLQHEQEPAEYDALLCHEVARTLHGVAFFNQAYQALAAEGQLIILDCFNQSRFPMMNETSPPVLSYTRAQLQRCGFEIVKELDLTQAARPSLDYWLQILQTHQHPIQEALSLSEAELTALCQRLTQQRQDFIQHQQTFTLLIAQKITAPRWRVNAVVPKDAEAVRQLFAEVFSPQQMSEAFWQWKYGQGRGLGIGAWTQAGKMVGHYGGVLREVRCLGQTQMGVQITDVMVSSQQRGVLTKRGAFFLITANFLEDYVGYGTPGWIGYGFPSERHLRLAAKQGLYESVSHVVELRYPAASQAKSQLWTRIRAINPAKNRDIRQLEQLWQRMAKDLSGHIVGIRNWEYIYYRYFAHPHNTYEALLISHRLTGSPLAVVVLKRDDTQCKWMDYIGALSALPIALQHVQQIAARWGVEQVQIWITRPCAAYFPQQDAQKNSVETTLLEIQIPHNVWSLTVDVNTIKDKWWLMMGDTDFL